MGKLHRVLSLILLFFLWCPLWFTTETAMLQPHCKVLQQNGLKLEGCPNQNGTNDTAPARLPALLLITKARAFSEECYFFSDCGLSLSGRSQSHPWN